MVSRILFTVILALSFNSISAQSVTEPQPEPKMRRIMIPEQSYEGILRFQGTLGVGRMTGFESTNIFLHGDLEYYFDKRFSVRSDVYFFLNSTSKTELVDPFKFYHSLFTGVEYHFLDSEKSDFYMGFQPGIGYGQRDYAALYDSCETCDIAFTPATKTVSPLISFNAGYNYFAAKFFHLFVHGRYIWGLHSDNYTSASLGEFRISFGLGFHFDTKDVLNSGNGKNTKQKIF